MSSNRLEIPTGIKASSINSSPLLSPKTSAKTGEGAHALPSRGPSISGEGLEDQKRRSFRGQGIIAAASYDGDDEVGVFSEYISASAQTSLADGENCGPEDFHRYLNSRGIIDRNHAIEDGRSPSVVLHDLIVTKRGFSWEKLIILAEFLIARGRYREAGLHLEEAVYGFSNPGRPTSCFVLLIECFSELGDWKRVAYAAKTYVRLYPSLETAHCAYIWSLRELGDYDAAIQNCDSALVMFPSSSMLFSLRGKLMYESGRYKSAVGDFHTSIELSRKDDTDLPLIVRSLKSWKRSGI